MSFLKCVNCGAWHPERQCPICHGSSEPPPTTSQPRGGPGTELETIIPKFFSSDACECKSYARKMDRWGVDGCRKRYDSIVDRLVQESGKIRVINLFGPINRIIAQRWVTQAIDNADKKENTQPITDNGDWFVALTTSPRNDCTLKESIASIRRAGWEPTVFAEPGSTSTNANTINNATKLGVWHNWLSSARYAIENTDASLILTVQDDCEFHPDSRTFVESVLWPSDDCGFLSLYTPRHYSYKKNGTTSPIGINRIRTRSLWGACALAWPREALERVVTSSTADTWLGAGPRYKRSETASQRRHRKEAWNNAKRDDPSKIANSDTAIGKIVNSLGLTMHFIDPSPVRHIGVNSTVGHGSNTGNRNCGRCADHDIPLVDQVTTTKESK